DAVLEEAPDLVVHSGDVFHHTRPTWHALRTFVRQTRRITAAGIPMVIIAGNHDTPRLRTDGTAWSVLELALPEIDFITGFEEESRRFDELGVQVVGVPHGAMSMTVYDPIVNVVPELRNILLLHGMVPGMADIAHYEPGTQEISTGLLDPRFEYIALGHFHIFSRQRHSAWYAGSTERFGWGDEEATPGFAIVEFTADSTEPEVLHHPIETRPMHTLQAINGEGRPPREIADSALKRAAEVGDITAMTRIELRGVNRATRREVEQLVRRELEGQVWSLEFFARTELAQTLGETTAIETEQLEVPALFEEFVAEQVKLGRYTPEFATSFRARGMAALGQAIEAVSLSLAEDER
ncbi:MAG: DNA repair exonuclease, partial [Thermomicrobiales bacterium]|nr:DNA repair exonuclease [Thermomicrobiales bacterium]